MIGGFIFKHGIKVAVFLLILDTLYNYTGRNSSETNGYKSVPIFGDIKCLLLGFIGVSILLLLV